MYFYCCLHWEGEGGLGTDISTMASVCKHSIEKIFHNRANIGNIFVLTLCSCHLFNLFSGMAAAAAADLVRVLTYQQISTMHGQCISSQLKKSK
jgi:hypothetical protein